MIFPLVFLLFSDNFFFNLKYFFCIGKIDIHTYIFEIQIFFKYKCKKNLSKMVQASVSTNPQNHKIFKSVTKF